MKTGYCAVCADILHKGHISFIRRARALCDHLIVGVMTDECIIKYKGVAPVMSYDERCAIIGALRDVGQLIPQNTFEFNVRSLEAQHGVGIIIDSVDHPRDGATVYLPYDKTISSTAIKERILKGRSSDKV